MTGNAIATSDMLLTFTSTLTNDEEARAYIEELRDKFTRRQHYELKMQLIDFFSVRVAGNRCLSWHNVWHQAQRSSNVLIFAQRMEKLCAIKFFDKLSPFPDDFRQAGKQDTSKTKGRGKKQLNLTKMKKNDKNKTKIAGKNKNKEETVVVSHSYTS